MIRDIFSDDQLEEILSCPEVQQANARTNIPFSIRLPESIVTTLQSKLGVQFSDSSSIPMQWIRGNTLPHIDKGSSPFSTTHLVYLTEDQGELRIGDESFPIRANTAYMFQEGIEHETIGTSGEPRLLIGPMSEAGLRVGFGLTLEYFPTQLDASGNTNSLYIDFTNTDISGEFIRTVGTHNGYSHWVTNNKSPQLFYSQGDTITIPSYQSGYYVLYPDPNYPVPCILQGTLVNTPSGLVPIERLTIGGSVIDENGEHVPIVHIEQTKIFYTECFSQACLSKKMYKVPKGLHGAKQDLFLTRNHEIVLSDGSLCIPQRCGAVLAKPEEIPVAKGWFSVYQLRLRKASHFFANGCLVTSLSSSSKGQAGSLNEPSDVTSLNCTNPQCRGSVKRIS
jgi:hypothetical protein